MCVTHVVGLFAICITSVPAIRMLSTFYSSMVVLVEYSAASNSLSMLCIVGKDMSLGICPYRAILVMTSFRCFLWQELGISILEMAVKACTKEIEKYKGKLLVKEPPRAVSNLQFIFGSAVNLFS